MRVCDVCLRVAVDRITMANDDQSFDVCAEHLQGVLQALSPKRDDEPHTEITDPPEKRRGRPPKNLGIQPE